MEIQRRKNYDEIVEILKKEKATIIFKKKNGELREMVVTRNFEFIPVEHYPKTKEAVSGVVPLDENHIVSDTVSVYSLGDKAWRSFKVDSLESISIC